MSWQLFDRLRAMFKQANIYRQEQLHQDQVSVERLAAGGRNSLNLATYGVLLEQTNLQINRLERFKDYDQMDEMGEISAALDMYADEATLIDPEHKHNVMIRTKYARVKNELSELFYAILCVDNVLRSWVRYLCKYGDLPLEIVPTKNRDGVASVRFLNVYNFSRIETKKGDLIGFFYQDEGDVQPTFMHPWQVVHMRLDSLENTFKPYGRSLIEGGRKDFKRLRLMEDAALIYRICLTGDSKIWTPGGFKFIKDITVNDEVFSYDASKKLIKTKVLHQVCNGVKPTYEVSTKHHTLRGTATHPFLVRDLVDGVEKYVDLKDLDPSRHVLVTPCVTGDGVCKKIDLWFEKEYGCLKPEALNEFRNATYENVSSLMRQIDHPIYLTRQVLYLGKGMPYDKLVELCGLLKLNVDSIDRYSPLCKGGSTLPPQVTSELARFIGFWFGDGYVTNANWRVGINLGSDMEINEHYVKLFKKFHQRVKIEFKNVAGTKTLNTAVVCDKQLYNTWLNLGLGGHAHTKRIPQWVYELPIMHKIEFVKGLVDADGTIRNGAECDYYEIEICNRELLEDLKVLCDQIGWVTGKIKTESREGGLVHMNGHYESHCLYINPIFKVGYEKIEDISYVGDEAVYDITVENENHNFVANGLVVHNTRAPERRVFKIPIGEIPAQHVPTYMEMFARNVKKRRFFNPSTGQVDERWSPLIQEDDYYLPRRPDGTGPEIDTLPGGENLDQIADIEYFKKKMVSAMKIPFARVGLGESGEDSRQSLSQVAPEFAKAVQFVQRVVAVGLQKVGLVHLALKSIPVNEMKRIELYLPASSAIDELYRIEKWATRADVIANLKDTELFDNKWILKTFTDMSEDEIIAMQKSKSSLPEEPGLGEDLGLPEEVHVDKNIIAEFKQLQSDYRDFKDKKTNELEEEITANMLVNLVNNNEFDGLKDKDDKILVEHSVDRDLEDNKVVIDSHREKFMCEWKEYKRQENIIKARQKTLRGLEEDNESDEITEKDIPT